MSSAGDSASRRDSPAADANSFSTLVDHKASWLYDSQEVIDGDVSHSLQKRDLESHGMPPFESPGTYDEYHPEDKYAQDLPSESHIERSLVGYSPQHVSPVITPEVALSLETFAALDAMYLLSTSPDEFLAVVEEYSNLSTNPEELTTTIQGPISQFTTKSSPDIDIDLDGEILQCTTEELDDLYAQHTSKELETVFGIANGSTIPEYGTPWIRDGVEKSHVQHLPVTTQKRVSLNQTLLVNDTSSRAELINRTSIAKSCHSRAPKSTQRGKRQLDDDHFHQPDSPKRLRITLPENSAVHSVPGHSVHSRAVSSANDYAISEYSRGVTEHEQYHHDSRVDVNSSHDGFVDRSTVDPGEMPSALGIFLLQSCLPLLSPQFVVRSVFPPQSPSPDMLGPKHFAPSPMRSAQYLTATSSENNCASPVLDGHTASTTTTPAQKMSAPNPVGARQSCAVQQLSPSCAASSSSSTPLVTTASNSRTPARTGAGAMMELPNPLKYKDDLTKLPILDLNDGTIVLLGCPHHQCGPGGNARWTQGIKKSNVPDKLVFFKGTLGMIAHMKAAHGEEPVDANGAKLDKYDARRLIWLQKRCGRRKVPKSELHTLIPIMASSKLDDGEKKKRSEGREKAQVKRKLEAQESARAQARAQTPNAAFDGNYVLAWQPDQPVMQFAASTNRLNYQTDRHSSHANMLKPNHHVSGQSPCLSYGAAVKSPKRSLDDLEADEDEEGIKLYNLYKKPRQI
ncbi:hypothetical protein BT63DRAFT_460721 [Microthyrium microscopicum]|uniref:Uncharacterized protein n=1 Tax=Microthyrium microscopicum TaxID=703497 RepID=A0A6A6TU65_9PEZI|nr:hypothetical protein BT63DRAFT_460721 [Microthyrium microscopicum]